MWYAGLFVAILVFALVVVLVWAATEWRRKRDPLRRRRGQHHGHGPWTGGTGCTGDTVGFPGSTDIETLSVAGKAMAELSIQQNGNRPLPPKDVSLRKEISEWMDANADHDKTAPLLAHASENTESKYGGFSTSKGAVVLEKETAVDRVAVVIGHNYVGFSSGQLLTCWNDAYAMADWAVRQGKVAAADVILLTDEPSPQQARRLKYDWHASKVNAFWQTTAKVVERALANDKKKMSTHILVFYSGHGTYKDDFTDSKENALTSQVEGIVFPDGCVWDAEILSGFLAKLPASASVQFVSDSCYSGSLCELPYCYNPLSNSLNQSTTDTNAFKAKVRLISGCGNNQTSDAGLTAKDLSALTAVVIANLKNNPTMPVVQLVELSRVQLRKQHHKQIPLASFSHSSDMDVPFFSA